MTTLLLPPRYTDDARLIWRAALSEGWPTIRLPAWTVPADIQTRDLAFYGEPLLAAHVAEELNLRFVEPQLDWLTTVPAEYLQRKIDFTTLEKARAWSVSAFMKPADDKAFPARVYNNGAALDASQHYEPDLPVLISEPLLFQCEYRFFLLDSEVETFSLYFRDGEVVEHAQEYFLNDDPRRAEALSFVRVILKDARIYLPPAVVLDVGVLASGKWAIVECNTAWGSGIYGCNPANILPVLKRACIPEEQSFAEDPRAFARRKKIK